MPKKRFTSQYSKPQSTVHPSLNSPATSSLASGSSKTNDAPATVNSILSNLRKLEKPPVVPSPPTIQPTLPPQIRTFLAQPETPAPTSRSRRLPRFDANGRPMPAGPAPPRSWLTGPSSRRGKRIDGTSLRYPTHVGHFPGLTREKDDGSLQDTCLRAMARNWEYVREYERYNLVYLPAALRMALLSYIAVYGPEEGVGSDGLKSILTRRSDDGTKHEDTLLRNDDVNESFYRLDVSGSIGRSVSFKQLVDLVQKPKQVITDEEAAIASWDETISLCISPILPYLKHLSLSHPPPTISWPRLLQLATHIPTLTHLSLAYWPVPSMTPNSTTAMMTSNGNEFQLGGTNYYSHCLDNDFYEAAKILSRLADRLYSLEYLDLTGCHQWFKALYWSGYKAEGLKWKTQWPKLSKLILVSGVKLHEHSAHHEITRFAYVIAHTAAFVERGIAQARKGRGWVDVQVDDLTDYDGLWKGIDADSKTKRKSVNDCMHLIRRLRAMEKLNETDQEGELARVQRASVWEQ